MSALLLGGDLAPIGLTVSFLRRPMPDVRESLLAWRRQELHQNVEELTAGPLPGCAAVLDPLEAPWTTELVVDCGAWTAYLNNFIHGGDPTAAAPYLGTRLACTCVVAMHAPLHGPGHASTSLRIADPDGTTVRVIDARAEDGRWSWRADGAIQPFEQPARYEARRKRDRFDRPLLVSYLEALGIRVDDAGFYGEGVGLRQIVEYPRRRESVAEARTRFGR